MKSTILLLLFISASILSNAQAPVIQWQKCFGGSSNETAYDIRQTSDGGFIVAGGSESNDGNVSGNHGLMDFWVIKINETGHIQWQKSLGGDTTDFALAIRQTTDGGYIVTGCSLSNDGEITGNHGYFDYWVVKLNDTGAIQWQKSLGGDTLDYASAIKQTTDGGYIVSGYSVSNNGNISGNHGGYDYWIVKLNDTGAIQWQKSLGGSNSDKATAIQQTADGGYIVAGTSQSNDGDVTVNHGGVDYWIVKLNGTGVIQWQKSLGGSNYDEATAIQQTSDGGYIIAGQSNSNDGDVSGNHGSFDYWIVKINDTGAIQWQKSIGGSSVDWAYSIQQTTDGGYVVAGSSYSNNGDVTGNHGSFDYWIVKLNDTGAIQWQKSLGGSLQDNATSIQQTTDGAYIIGGVSYSNDGDVTASHGNGDFWIVKLTCIVNPGIITGDSIICKGRNMVLTDTVSGGVWHLANSNASISGGIITGLVAGNDTAFYTVTNESCVSTATIAFPFKVILCPSEVNQLSGASENSIIPNPTTGLISISGITHPQIKIYNPLGQLIISAANTNTISIREFPAGLYFIRVFNEQGDLLKQENVVKVQE